MAVAAQASINRSLFSFVRQIKMPKIGELREPLSFYTADRLPVKNEDGTEGFRFDEIVKPFANAWGKAWQFQGQYLKGQNTQNTLSHIFLVRRSPELQIEANCYLVWQGKIFLVRGARGVDDVSQTTQDGNKYLVILCDEGGAFTEEERVVLDSAAEDDGSQNATVDLDNPLWR